MDKYNRTQTNIPKCYQDITYTQREEKYYYRKTEKPLQNV
jgi:hypothetical protein